MNILQIVSFRQYRGAELSAWNLSKQLQEEGNRLFWVGLFTHNETELVLPNAVNADMPGRKKYLNFEKVKALKKFIREHNIDVIQANGAETLKYAVAATMFRKSPPIIYRNISQVSFWMKNSFFKRMLSGFLLGRADAIVSVGKISRNDVVAAFPNLESKTSVIYRGVPINIVSKDESDKKVRARFSLSHSARILSWVGALSSEKNPFFMIDVMKKVVEKIPEAILLMAGKGPLENDLKKEIEVAGLGSSVLLVGYQSNLEEVYAASELFLLASETEGVPGVILEAAIQSTPSVAVNVGGVTEVVRQKETGLVISGHDATEFSKAVLDLLNEPAEIKRLGANAAAYVTDQFNEKQNAKKFLSLYNKMKESA